MPLPTASVSRTCWSEHVYEPSDDTFLLTDALEALATKQWQQNPPNTVVEIGCGSGFVICSAALLLKHLGCMPKQLLGVDHSAAALAATHQTLSDHNVQQYVELLQADLCSAWHTNLKGHVDLLLFNPPYVPTPDMEWSGSYTSVASAWAGGHAGRRVIDRLLPQLSELLSPQGSLLMVTVSENDPAGIIRQMEGLGFVGRVVVCKQADEESLQIICIQRTHAGVAAGTT